LHFYDYLPFEKDLALDLHNFEFPLPKDDLYQVLLKLACCFWIIYLIINNLLFSFRSRIFHLYGDFTIAGEGLQNLGLCSAHRAFEQGGIFIVPHLL
jgi:hypothetical protein